MSVAASGSAMRRPLQGVDPSTLSAARTQVHQAVQWLARAAYAYIDPSPGDEHSNLGWDDAFDGFVTRPLPGDAGLGLNLSRLELVCLGPQGRESFALDGRSNAKVRLWLGQQIAADGLSADVLDHGTPYTIPEHAIATRGRRRA